MIVNTLPIVKPIFNPIDPICQGATAPSLPTTSTNGITGTWNPSAINTSSAGGTIYTFTPSAGQCASSTTLSVTINPNIPLSFNPIGPFCQGFPTPAALPATSIEGVAGVWSPSSINTAFIGKNTYTFTPSSGQCGTPTMIDIEITSQIVPTFDPLGPLCQNSNPPALPRVSADGLNV